MRVTLGKNLSSMKAQRQLGLSDQSLSRVFERLSSGQRINRASDDAAGLAVASSLKADERVYRQGIRNLNDGISLLNIADATVGELTTVVTRIQELATQAANGSLSNTQRASLDAEAQALRDEFFRISRATEFNGINLFDGSITNGVRLQGGYGQDGSIFSSLGGELGDGTFDVSTMTVGQVNMHFGIGDFNGDGNTDFAAMNTSTDVVEVYLGSGNGTFSQSSTISALTSSMAGMIESADFNNDGYLDIVFGDNFEMGIALGNGDGSFQSAATIQLGGANAGIYHAVSDINNDGNMDIVTTADVTFHVAVMLGQGDGTFTASQTFAAPYSSYGIALGDVNGDGVDDLVATDSYSTKVFVQLGTGGGTFSSAVSYDAGATADSVAIGDINNDGHNDLVLGSSNIVVMLGDSSGEFNTASTVATPTSSTKVNLGDFNGDGNEDVFAIGSGSGTIALGDGEGSFTTSQTVTLGFASGVAGTSDFNNDGVLDILAPSITPASTSILLGNTREGISPILEFSLGTKADALQALAPLERKLNSLSQQRGVIGAFQSRVQSAVSQLGSTSENVAAAYSRIVDADIATESANLTRLSILKEATTAVLAQANLQPSLALELLKA